MLHSAGCDAAVWLMLVYVLSRLQLEEAEDRLRHLKETLRSRREEQRIALMQKET